MLLQDSSIADWRVSNKVIPLWIAGLVEVWEKGIKGCALIFGGYLVPWDKTQHCWPLWCPPSCPHAHDDNTWPCPWLFIFTNSLPICSGSENSFPAWNLAAASSLCLKHESPELSNKPVYTSRHNHCPSNHSVLFNVKPIICMFCLHSSSPPPPFLPLFSFSLYLLDVLQNN